MAELEYVTARLNYAAPMAETPEVFFYDPGTERVKNSPKYVAHQTRIHDFRGSENHLSLDREGVIAIPVDAPLDPHADAETVRKHYYPAVADHVKSAVGAADVHVFDHNFRSDQLQKTDKNYDKPARSVHNDYTPASGPQRLRELLPESAGALLRRRYCFINLWRPLSHPVEDSPLAVCAANSVAEEDFVILALRYRNRDGQVYLLRHNPAHKWYYRSAMQPDEGLLLKCFDSETDGRARFAPHSAFTDPKAPPDALPRQSIEARTIAFFDR